MPVDDTVEQLTLLDKLRRKRDEDVNALATLIEKRETERTAFETRDTSTDDKPTDEQRSAFAAAEEAFGGELDRRNAEISTLERRIAEQEVIEKRRQAAANASGTSVSVESEPLTYRADNAHRTSYFRDLASTVASDVGNPVEARDRLQRHAAEMALEMPKREASREQRAAAQLDRAERDFTGSLTDHIPGLVERGLAPTAFERRVNPSTTDGQGGYAIPPLWLIDEYLMALRAGRVASNLARQMTLPEGTNSINIPKLSTGTVVGFQAADGAPVPSQDLTDTSISADVKTIAGQEDVAVQLLDQSPGQIMDRVIMEDLLADYNRAVDRAVIIGSGGAQQIKGIWPATNWGAGTITTGAVAANSGQAFFQTQGAMLAKLATRRFSTENVHFLMHPRRWYWWATTLESGATGTTGRPFLSGLEAAAIRGADAAEGRVGQSILGPHDYYTSANSPATDNGSGLLSGTYDPVLAAKWDDIWLFEGALRTRVLTEVLSGTLQIRFQVYNYVCLIVRYGESIVVAQGAGLAAPVGSVDTAMVFGA